MFENLTALNHLLDEGNTLITKNYIQKLRKIKRDIMQGPDHAANRGLQQASRDKTDKLVTSIYGMIERGSGSSIHEELLEILEELARFFKATYALGEIPGDHKSPAETVSAFFGVRAVDGAAHGIRRD